MIQEIKSIRPIVDDSLKQVFIETYGCQMNVNDSEVVLAILQECGYTLCDSIGKADLILVNTCSIRENAEQRIFGRLDIFRLEKKRRKGLIVGVIGCMAERMKDQLLEHPVVDIVVGPDAYRSLPELLLAVNPDNKQIDVKLSRTETYDDITPVRMDKNGVSAYISIMRGCNNVCSYCIVPYTRGAERSRDPQTIIREAKELYANGYKEVNLLGQNVDSYRWKGESENDNVDFAKLLEMVAQIAPDLRVRFSTSHPKDMTADVVKMMAKYPNICKHIHLPVQSGSSDMLLKMNRKYDREKYLSQIATIRELIPDCSITTDVIVGFSGESEEDYQLTLSLFEEVKFDSAFMFYYSERPGTKASRHYPDDISIEVKTERLNKIIELQNKLSLESNKADVGKVFEVLIEGASKRSESQLIGRTSQNKVCVFTTDKHKAGDYATVRVTSCTSATLMAELI